MNIKELTGKAVSGVKSGFKFAGDQVSKSCEKIKDKVEHDKLEKKKNDYLLRAFEKEANDFIVLFNDGKQKKIKGLYESNEDCLMIHYEIDMDKVECLKDNRHQTYYIKKIDLNGYEFTCEYEGEKLVLPLEKVIYTNTKPMPTTVNNYNITDNSSYVDNSIKTKNSNINSNGSRVSNENNIGAHIHMPEQK